ncbi:MAG: PKD domain-containing protein [Saprospiraceae bacterium]|nr:PKD domain-containing protein [Saprospiraceae bacterium]
MSSKSYILAFRLVSALAFFALATWFFLQKNSEVSPIASNYSPAASVETDTELPEMAEAIAPAAENLPVVKPALTPVETTTELAAKPAKPAKYQRIGEAFEDRRRRTMDPALGYAPSDRLLNVFSQAKRKQEAMLMDESKNSGDIGNARWRERGPSNIGGRTRSLLIDANDPSGKRVWAGSVSGGLWRCNDITADVPSWTPINDYFPNLAVMDIVQHPSNPNLMYFCTGEWTDVRGIGVFRSSDGGNSWEHLPNTVGFQYSYKMLVHPNGDVYNTTSRGVWRSQDGGNNWTRVIGNGVSGVNSAVFYDIKLAADGNIYVSSNNTIYKSPSGNIGAWSSITNTAGAPPSSSQRLEFDVSDTNPQVIFAVNNIGGDVEGIYKTINGGSSWAKMPLPGALGMDNFARGQAWYDLDIAIHPEDHNRIIVGGIDPHISTNGGIGWTQIGQWFGGGGIQYVHADQHRIVFDTKNTNVAYLTNDGGVWRTQNVKAPGSQIIIRDRNNSYNVTQFYAGAIHPETAKSYYIGGTQDNGSLALSDIGISAGREVLGGDGFFCHIDEDEPNIQMVSLYYANYSLSTDGGRSFSGGAALEGNFLSASDYDSRTNTLYSQTNAADFYRWNVSSATTTPVDVDGLNLDVSAVTVDRNTPNRVYFGNFGNGRIVRVDNAHTGETVSGVELAPLAGTISGIAVEDGNAQHLMATVSNYGVASVFESFDGGQSWINVEGDLPDMPVNFCLFNPNNNRQALIATEAGVWSTELLDGSNTVWLPPATGRGTPFVRTDMLRLRRSDKVVLAATYGRGMFTSDVFADPAARMAIERVSYTNVPVRFLGELSTNADSYLWNFGDGSTSTNENTEHSYPAIGEYPVTLTINNALSASSSVKILPDLSIPWKADQPGYGGSFESNTEQYGVHTISGSSFERGRSGIAGKDGVKTGQNAFVLGLNEPFYQANTHTMLYLPDFDLSEQGLYEFSFWGKWRIHPGFDGFRVEYSTDRGRTWRVLGNDIQSEWYNQRNSNLDDAVFPVGTSYFSGNRFDWQKYRFNISFLAGNPDVAFRFVFRSDNGGNHIGLAIDDVQVDKYEGELKTELIRFEGSYVSGATSVKLDWTTLPEYYCSRIEVERSVNGREFERIASLNATGRRTADPQLYTHTSLAQRNLYFYRLKVISEEPAIGYSYEFYSPVIAMQRSTPAETVNRIFPSPATTFVGVTFNGVVTERVDYEVYDAAGRLVLRGRSEGPGPYLEIDLGDRLAKAMYVLRLRVGDKNWESFKFAGGW